jgi:hypothetical protein
MAAGASNASGGLAMARAKPKPARLVENGPLKIAIGFESDGCVYELDSSSEDRVAEAYPNVPRLPAVLFGFSNRAEFQTLHGPLWPVVGELLTGLTRDQIAELGGLRIYDPVKRTLVWEWRPELAKAK